MEEEKCNLLTCNVVQSNIQLKEENKKLKAEVNELKKQIKKINAKTN